MGYLGFLLSSLSSPEPMSFSRRWPGLLGELGLRPAP